MIRLSEEQIAIIGCYPEAKEEVISEMKKAIMFIEDIEIKEMTSELLRQIEEMSDDKWGKYNESARVFYT